MARQRIVAFHGRFVGTSAADKVNRNDTMPCCDKARMRVLYLLESYWHLNAIIIGGKTVGSSELHIEFFKLVWLCLGGLYPFDHGRMRHHPLAISVAFFIQLHVIGRETRTNWRIHGICHGDVLAKEIRALVTGKAAIPDGDDVIDISLRPSPDLEAGISRLQVHRQRCAQI